MLTYEQCAALKAAAKDAVATAAIAPVEAACASLPEVRE